MKRTLQGFVLVVTGLAVTSWTAAHDFWLVPLGDELHGISGSSFPVSENAVTPDRLAAAVAVHAAGRTALTIVGTRGNALVLKADPQLSGPLWAAVAIKPREIRLSASEFNEYLRHDGLPQILAAREANGQVGRPAVERYSKFAKALVVRPGGAVAVGEPVGHRIEIVPLGGAVGLRAGDTLRVEVRFEGRPISELTVHAGYAGQPGGAHAQTHVTDTGGQVRIPLPAGGTWYDRTIHMRPAEPPFDWESFWASLTFPVR